MEFVGKLRGEGSDGGSNLSVIKNGFFLIGGRSVVMDGNLPFRENLLFWRGLDVDI